MNKKLRLTADTSANRSLLRKLKREGIVSIDYINLENAKREEVDTIPAFAMFDVSTYNDGDVLASADAIDIHAQLKSIVGGGRNNYEDRRQLLGHYYSGNDVFVTGDKDDIYKKRDELARIGILVLHNDELEVYAERYANEAKK